MRWLFLALVAVAWVVLAPTAVAGFDPSRPTLSLRRAPSYPSLLSAATHIDVAPAMESVTVVCGSPTSQHTAFQFPNGLANSLEVVLCIDKDNCDVKAECTPNLPPHTDVTMLIPDTFNYMTVLFCAPGGTPCMGARQQVFHRASSGSAWQPALGFDNFTNPFCEKSGTVGVDFCAPLATYCPRDNAGAVCSDRGDCVPTHGAYEGTCKCHHGWTGPACNLTVVPSLNCTAQPNLTASSVYRFADDSLNSLRFSVCSDGPACATEIACQQELLANTTRDLVVPLGVNFIQETVCSPDGVFCFADYTVNHTLVQGVWDPALVFQNPGYEYCATSVDCWIGNIEGHAPPSTSLECVAMNVSAAVHLPHPTWNGCVECPASENGAVCNGHGVCYGTGDGATGWCDCLDGWNGTACSTPPYALVNCSSTDTPDVATYPFVNNCSNPMRVIPCDDPPCSVTASSASICRQLLVPGRTMDLLVPDTTTALALQACPPSDPEHCMPLVRQYALNTTTGTWTPPLSMPMTSQVYCDSDDDCSNGRHCVNKCPMTVPWFAPCSGHGSCFSHPTGIAGGCLCHGGWQGDSCSVAPPDQPLLLCVEATQAPAQALPFQNMGANALSLHVCRNGSALDDADMECHQCQDVIHGNTSWFLIAPLDATVVTASSCTAAGSPCFLDKTRTYTHTAEGWSPPLETPPTDQMYCDYASDCAPGDQCLPSNYSSSQSGPLWPAWDVCVDCPKAPGSQLQCNGHGTCSAAQGTSPIGYCHCEGLWSGPLCETPPAHPVINCASAGADVESYVFTNLGPNALQLYACLNSCDVGGGKELVCPRLVSPWETVDVVIPAAYHYLQVSYCVESPPAQKPACTAYTTSFRKDFGSNTWTPPLQSLSTNRTFCSESTDCALGETCESMLNAVAGDWKVCTTCPGFNSSTGAVCSGRGVCSARPDTMAGNCTCSDSYSGAACSVAPRVSHPTSIPWYWFVLGACGFLVLVCITVYCIHARRRKSDHLTVVDGAGQVLLDKNLSLPRAMKKQDHVIDFRKITIGEKIAAGSNATVYRGVYLGVPVALKEIYYSVFDMQAVEHFRQEAAILGNLQHPHIVRLYGVCHRSPHLYLVTELMQTSLQRLLHGAPIPLETRLRIAVQICYGMAFLHSVKIVHRDLKPGNVLLDSELNVKICDFGLARPSSHNDMTGFLGTPAYMAPETMSGPRVKYSKTVDMYAFGVMCSELLTWTRAYHNVTVASVFALRDRVVNHQLRPTIPEHIRNASPTTRIVAELCERCWSANAEERPTFADVTVELENVINNPTVDSSDDDGEEEAKRSCGGADTMSLGSGFASRASRGDGDVAVRIEGLSAISTGTGSLPRRPADPM